MYQFALVGTYDWCQFTPIEVALGVNLLIFLQCIETHSRELWQLVHIRELSNVPKTATFELSYSVSQIRTIQLLGLKTINKHARIQRRWGGQGVRTP